MVLEEELQKVIDQLHSCQMKLEGTTSSSEESQKIRKELVSFSHSPLVLAFRESHSNLR